MRAFLLLGSLVLAGCGASGGGSSAPADRPSAAGTDSELARRKGIDLKDLERTANETTPGKIVVDYKENPVAADAKYKDGVRVKLVAANLDRGPDGEPVIGLFPLPWAAPSIIFFHFSKDQEAAFAKLKTGDAVTIEARPGGRKADGVDRRMKGQRAPQFPNAPPGPGLYVGEYEWRVDLVDCRIISHTPKKK